MLLDKVTILKQVARIPVILRILLLVWQKDSGHELEAGVENLCFLYNLLVCHIIDRFFSREPSTERNSR